MSNNAQRIQLADTEINWVFGGGIVPGSLTLVAGPPGVGKSTLSLQIAHMMANASQGDGSILYVSGEESVTQVKMRSDRLALQSTQLYLASETNIENIIQMIHDSSPCRGVVVDSIQTMYSSEISSTAGNVNQVKECTLQLLGVCKDANIPVIIIGHITKSGDIAGPKVLEHIVDTVVQLDGESHSSNRFLRCTKNRFGTTSEVGVLSMTDVGLIPVSNPLHAFISSGNNSLEGVSVTIAVEGSRPIPVEIQSLSNPSFDDRTTCRCHGVSYDKLQLIFAVLERRANVSFRSKSVFVNIAQGYSLDEPCADLALAVALASTATKRPAIPNTVFMGELALSGTLRPIVKLEPRLAAACKIGVETCVIPTVDCDESRKTVQKYSSAIKILQVDTLVEALAVSLIKV
ncbi:Aste57867_7716 [Aphanomyces stellatus]|uniref:Aste57867_7716 protein n=1 Tax=Aphanomyces stellatus TaxID=120398 RepID=A0A485KIP4_9STRA|nr:hypothetical protein As57867_007687 [Aphanomyces stellatus]VFT84619.1 Aste57867_7716 [Aphanomyces stellatus]